MKQLLLILLAFTAFNVFSQPAPVVVHDPVGTQLKIQLTELAAKNTTLQAMVSSNITQLALRAAGEISTDFISDLKTLGLIAKLIENLACRTDDLNVLINITAHGNCIFDYSFDQVFANLNFSIDMLKFFFVGQIIVTASGSDRQNALNNILVTLQNAVATMDFLASGLRLNLRNAVENIHNEVIIRERSINMATNRYVELSNNN